VYQQARRWVAAGVFETITHDLRAIDLLAVTLTAANEQERAEVADLAKQAQAVTGRTVEVALVDQGYTGEDTADRAKPSGWRW
jgi:transposase